MRLDARKCLIDALIGRPCNTIESEDAAAVLGTAQREGVVALIEKQWASHPENAPTSSPLRMAFAEATRRQAACLLWIRAEAQRLLTELHAQGVQVLVLKGVALGDWLYPETYLRASNDLDVLVATAEDAQRASEILAGLGFAAGYVQGRHAYERLCESTSATSPRLEVDLHWRLLNAPVFAQALMFRDLWQDSIPLPGLGSQAWGLCPVHALVHAAMNRVVNLYTGVGDLLKCLYDIHVLIAQLDAEDWTHVVELCSRAGLCGVVHSALEAARKELRTDVPSEILHALEQRACLEKLKPAMLSDWRYMQRQNLRALPWQARPSWLWERLFPDPTYLQHSEGAEKSLARQRLSRIKRLWRRMKPGLRE